MELIETAVMIGIATEGNGDDLSIKEVAMLSYDGIAGYSVDFEKDNEQANTIYAKNIQDDLDSASAIIGFCPTFLLSKLRKYGLTVPKDKIIDLINPDTTDINAQIYQFVKEWNADYPAEAPKSLSVGEQIKLISDLYYRICNNDKSPRVKPDPDSFDYIDAYDGTMSF